MAYSYYQSTSSSKLLWTGAAPSSPQESNITFFYLCHYYYDGGIIIIIKESTKVEGIKSFTPPLPARQGCVRVTRRMWVESPAWCQDKLRGACVVSWAPGNHIGEVQGEKNSAIIYQNTVLQLRNCRSTRKKKGEGKSEWVSGKLESSSAVWLFC